MSYTHVIFLYISMIVTIGILSRISESTSEAFESLELPRCVISFLVQRRRDAPGATVTHPARDPDVSMLTFRWSRGTIRHGHKPGAKCGQHVDLLSQDGQGWPLCTTLAFSLERFWQALTTSIMNQPIIASQIKEATGQSYRIHSIDVCHREAKF